MIQEVLSVSAVGAMAWAWMDGAGAWVAVLE
jgi:hypothetical protein